LCRFIDLAPARIENDALTGGADERPKLLRRKIAR
jgi:hypothetical protein